MADAEARAARALSRAPAAAHPTSPTTFEHLLALPPASLAPMLSCLSTQEALPLRSTCRAAKSAVAAHPWADARTPVARLAAWRSCFPAATALRIAPHASLSESDVVALAGLESLDASGYRDAAFLTAALPTLAAIPTLRLHSCPPAFLAAAASYTNSKSLPSAALEALEPDVETLKRPVLRSLTRFILPSPLQAAASTPSAASLLERAWGTSNAAKVALYAAGGVSAALRVLRVTAASEAVAAGNACSILAATAASAPALRASLVRGGALGPVVSALQAHPCAPELVLPAVRFLKAVSGSHGAAVVEAGAVGACLSALQAKPPLNCEATAAVARLLDETLFTAAEGVLVQPSSLRALLAPIGPHAQCYVAPLVVSILGKLLSGSEEALGAARDVGLPAAFAATIQTGLSSRFYTISTKELVRACEQAPDLLAALVDAGVVSNALAVMKPPSAPAGDVYNALELLNGFVGVPAARKAMVDGLVGVLRRLGGVAAVASEAMTILARAMEADEACAKIFVLAGGVPDAVAAMQRDTAAGAPVGVHAAAALKALVGLSPRFRRTALDAGCVNAAIAILERNLSASVRAVLAALSLLAVLEDAPMPAANMHSDLTSRGPAYGNTSLVQPALTALSTYGLGRAPSERSPAGAGGGGGGGGGGAGGGNGADPATAAAVADAACAVIRRLVGSSIAATHSLLDAGGTPHIVEALRLYADSPTIVEGAVGTLGNVAFMLPSRRQTVTEAGALYPCLDACARHIAVPGIAAVSLAAVQALVTDSKQRMKGVVDRGVIPLAVRALTLHPSNADVAKNAAELLTMLVRGNRARAQAALEAGGVAALLAALASPCVASSAPVSTGVISAVSSLLVHSESSPHDALIYSGLPVVVAAMQSFSTKADLLCQAGALLRTIGGSSEAGAEAVAEAGGVTALVGALRALPDSQPVTDVALDALQTLAAADSPRRGLISEAGGVALVIGALQTHLNNARIISMGAAVLELLARDCGARAAEIAEAGALPAMLAGLRSHGPSDAPTAAVFMRLIVTLLSGPDVVLEAFMDAGGAATAITAVNGKWGTGDAGAGLLRALRAAASRNEALQEALGAAKLVVKEG